MKKQEIIKKCKELLKDIQSSKDLTLINVARECNIGKSTIYEYFKTKNELLKETIEYIFQELFDIIESLTFQNLNYRDSFILIIRTYIENQRENRRLMVNIFLQSDLHWSEEESIFLKNLQYKLKAVARSKFEEIIRKGIQENQIDSKKFRCQYANFFEGFVIGNIMLYDKHIKEMTEEEYYSGFFELFTNIIQKSQ